MSASKGKDARHVVIDGRAWRRSDPGIPEPLRTQLVRELMSARRAAKAALAAEDDRAERAARARVQDAKLALGERGRAWWERASAVQLQRRAEATIRTLLRARGPEKTICPSDVARTIGGAEWRARMPWVRALASELAKHGLIEVRQKGKVVVADQACGPIRIGLKRRRARALSSA